MAKPPDPGVPHPSLQSCDLFFLAGDLDTAHWQRYRNQGINTPSLALSHLTTLILYLSHPLNSVLQIYLQEQKRKQCDVGVVDVG